MSGITPRDRALFHEAIYLTGPTGVGKTEISLTLAERLGAEILALDAMTLYRGLDIGTAKPRKAELERIPHHLIDRLSPREPSSLDLYLSMATPVLKMLAERETTALFVGGSPLYLKACLRGLSELPSRDERIRTELEKAAHEIGVESLHERLVGIDPESASKIATTDLRRLVRALEIYELTGLAPSRLRGDHDRPAPATVAVVALIRDRKSLYDRIDRRVEEMFKQGLLEEAAALERPLSQTAMQAVGYAEAFEVLDGRISVEQAIERTQRRTRHYAKHQMTWFRRLEEVRGLRIEDEPPERIVDKLLEMIRSIRSGASITGDPIE